MKSTKFRIADSFSVIRVVEGWPVVIEDKSISLFVHRTLGHKRLWNVSEEKTGMAITDSCTSRGEAIQQAKTMLAAKTQEAIDSTIHTILLTQVRMRTTWFADCLSCPEQSTECSSAEEALQSCLAAGWVVYGGGAICPRCSVILGEIDG